MSALILIYYNLYQPIKLETNTLNEVVAEVLSQLDIDKNR